MSYSRNGLGLVAMMKPKTDLLSTPKGTAAPASAPSRMLIMPSQATIDAGRAASAPVASIVTAECSNYQYVVRYKPLPRTGIVRAGTPIVASKQITWNPSLVGTDFPGSWVTLLNNNADTRRQALDETTHANNPALTDINNPAYLTAATKAFLIGFHLLGENAGILYVGAVSTKDVNMEQMQYFLQRLLSTAPKRVEPPGFGLVAFAAVPLKQVGEIPHNTDPLVQSVARPERIGAQYDIDTARAVAIGAALALKEALQVMVSGEIFGGAALGSPAPPSIPGMSEVVAAVAALNGVAELSTLPEMLSTSMTSMLAEAEAAKTQTPADGDKVCADILSRLGVMRDALSADLGRKISALAIGSAALPGAQTAVSAYANDARTTEARARQLVQDKINLVESKPAFTNLADGEKHAVHCILLNKAAPIVARNTAIVQPAFEALAAISATDFPVACASASAAYEQALAQATATIGDTIAKVEAIRKQIALKWYARDFHGFPVWMWGAGGAVLLVGGAVAVRMMRKKKAPAALPAK